jgi:hypothetical protein
MSGSAPAHRNCRQTGVSVTASVFTFSGAAGEFSLVGGSLDFTAGIAAEPEPGSFRLLLLGLFAIGWNLRSRRPSPVA